MAFTKIVIHQIILATGQLLSVLLSQEIKNKHLFASKLNIKKGRYWCILLSGLFNSSISSYISNILPILVCSLFTDKQTDCQYIVMLISSQIIAIFASISMFPENFIMCGNSIQSFCLIGYSLMYGNFPVLSFVFDELNEIISRTDGKINIYMAKRNTSGRLTNHLSHILGLILGIVFGCL